MGNPVISLTFVLSFCVVLCFSPVKSLRHRFAPCEITKPCVCEFSSAEGIDLSVLSDMTLSANMTTNVSVLFQPCKNITVQNSCNTTSLCIFNSTSNQSIALGDISDLKFLSENEVKPVQLQFVHKEITSTVELTCLESGNETTFTGNRENNNQYHFVLKSPAACLRPLGEYGGKSLLSVFLISALIVGLTYLVAMIIVRHSRGAVGWELFPHYDTCMRLPNLCHDGWNSLSSCCKQPSYQQI